MVYLGGDPRKPYGSLEERLGGKEPCTGCQQGGSAVDNWGSFPPGTIGGQY